MDYYLGPLKVSYNWRGQNALLFMPIKSFLQLERPKCVYSACLLFCLLHSYILKWTIVVPVPKIITTTVTFHFNHKKKSPEEDQISELDEPCHCNEIEWSSCIEPAKGNLKNWWMPGIYILTGICQASIPHTCTMQVRSSLQDYKNKSILIICSHRMWSGLVRPMQLFHFQWFLFNFHYITDLLIYRLDVD